MSIILLFHYAIKNLNIKLQYYVLVKRVCTMRYDTIHGNRSKHVKEKIDFFAFRIDDIIIYIIYLKCHALSLCNG